MFLYNVELSARTVGQAALWRQDLCSKFLELWDPLDHPGTMHNARAVALT